MSIPIYILAGGHSSRFGSPKVDALWQGKSLLTHVSETLAPWSSQHTIVSSFPPQINEKNLPRIPDTLEGIGPIGGLLAALHDLDDERAWCFLTTCDFLGFRHTWLESLWSARQPHDQAIAFFGERWQPLFAFYRKTALSQVQQAIQNEQYAMWRLLETLHTNACPLPSDWNDATQINTTAQLQQHQNKLTTHTTTP